MSETPKGAVTKGTPRISGSAALATSTIFAALLAVPAAFRADAAANPLLVWLILAGAGALVCGTLAASLATLRAETHGLKTLALAAAVSLPVLAVFGKVLEATTHHRGLGGVTFAVAGALVMLFSLAGANRLWRWADSPGKARGVAALAVLLLLAGVRFCLPLVSAASGRTALLDGGLLLAGAILASMWVPHTFLQNRVLARVMWGGLCSVALILALASPATGQGAREAAPVLFGPFWALSR